MLIYYSYSIYLEINNNIDYYKRKNYYKKDGILQFKDKKVLTIEELFDVIQPVHLIQTFILTVNAIIYNLPWERILLDLINMGQFNNNFC